MRAYIKSGCRLVALMAISALHFVDIQSSAQTVVTKDGDCEFTIHIPLEIYGPNATPELADRWKKNIEGAWNGPTEELVRNFYDSAGHRDEPLPVMDKNWRDRFKSQYEDMLTTVGDLSSAANVNCCKI